MIASTIELSILRSLSHVNNNNAEPSQDCEEEAVAGQREKEGSGQLGVRQNRFQIGETDG